MREMQRRAGVEITAVSLRVLITCYTGRALAHGKVLGTKPEGVFAPAIRPSLPSPHNQAVQVISPWEHSSTLCSDCASNVSGRKVLEEPAPRGTCPCCVAVSCWQGGCCGGAPAALGFCSSLTKKEGRLPSGSNTAGKEHTGLDRGAGGRLCCCMLLENSDRSVSPPVLSSTVLINVGR